MNWKSQWKPLAYMIGAFLVLFYLPVGKVRFDNALMEAFHLAKWYAREHVILCLVPAFFIAGAIAVFVSKASVMKYLGAKANKLLSYGVASVSGSILAVCSCTVLPLFAGIYRMGAGLGPATAFLYAINVLAIILTARVLGLEIGIARAVGAVLFSIVIGLMMHLIFIKEETEKVNAQAAMPEPEVTRPPTTVAERVVFRGDGGHFGVRQLGQTGRGGWFLVFGLFPEVDNNRCGVCSAGIGDGVLVWVEPMARSSDRSGHACAGDDLPARAAYCFFGGGDRPVDHHQPAGR